ncbi:MAG TPA: hypothetical protein ENI66_01545 [Candidatus Yonathbacteria bacterium]|mgnify:CR=1 FL=1|nr:hypothetical protein [Candidatus Yonathbacteria bacterium]
MYKIIASEYPEGAIVEIDGKLFYSMGPRLLQSTRERDLQESDEGDLRSMIRDGFIRHEPPTEVEDIREVHEAAKAYEESVRIREHAKAS